MVLGLRIFGTKGESVMCPNGPHTIRHSSQEQLSLATPRDLGGNSSHFQLHLQIAEACWTQWIFFPFSWESADSKPRISLPGASQFAMHIKERKDVRCGSSAMTSLNDYIPSSLLWGSLFAASVSVLCLSQARKRRSRKRFPSPPGTFFVGHLQELTQGVPWLTITEWKKEYGEPAMHDSSPPVLINTI